MSRDPVRLFYSYSDKDEALRGALETHLSTLRRQGLIAEWDARCIPAGSDWRGQIDHHLKEAELILLLLSTDFLASDYLYEVEAQQALARHADRTARVVPVLLRPVDLHNTPVAALQALPKSGKPVTKWRNRDEAWLEVARGIRQTVAELHGRRPTVTTMAAAYDMENDPRILVIEDSANWRRTLQRTLRRLSSDPHIEEAGDYQTALRRLSNEAYDLVILDLKIPESSAANDTAQVRMDLLLALRASPHNGYCGLIVLTGYLAKGRTRTMSRDFTVDFFLEKEDFDNQRFIPMAREALRRGLLRHTSTVAAAPVKQQ